MNLSRAAAYAAIGLLLTTAGCGGDDDGDPAPTTTSAAVEPIDLKAAFDTCVLGLFDVMMQTEGVPDGGAGDYMSITDEDQTILITSGSTYSRGVTYALAGASCVLDAIGAPSSIEQQIGASSAMSGSQSAEYNGITITWTPSVNAGSQAIAISFTSL